MREYDEEVRPENGGITLIWMWGRTSGGALIIITTIIVTVIITVIKRANKEALLDV